MSHKERISSRKIVLSDLNKQLQQYVHAPGCSNYINCPIACCKAEDELDLSTSIAWEVANTIGCTLRICSIHYHGNSERIKRLEEFVSVLLSLENIIDRHHEKYEALSALIRETTENISDISHFLACIKSDEDEVGIGEEE